MDEQASVKDVQLKILEIMKHIDKLCRDNGIVYYIMGGTALGAVRHGGFIPWDDDLDIFMTPDQYKKFKDIFEKNKDNLYILQEWKTSPNYLEYAKVRMNGTTFIEHGFRNRKDIHQGIYVDIMILHKVPKNRFVQKIVYVESKFVTLYALSQRNWCPKTKFQKIALQMMRILPSQFLTNRFYRRIYRYDSQKGDYMYCYWITPAKFRNGLFAAEMFSNPIDIPFEGTNLLGSAKIKEYLEYRYGDYMKLPSEEQRRAAVHAEIYDINKDYREYI